MEKINQLDEYKNLYYKEIEHSERLNNKINACMTFLTILGSGQVLLWTQFRNFNLRLYSIIYICLCIVSLILFVIGAVKFYKSFSGYKYNYFPIKEMALKSIEIHNIAKASENEDDIKLADDYIYNMYCERFLNDAIKNRNVNIEKNTKHKNLITTICISFIVTAIVFSYGLGIDYYETNYVDQNVSHVIIDGGELNCQTMK